jgi:hypothetical protein
MGIVSPTVEQAELKEEYERKFLEFTARYREFITGASYRIHSGQTVLKGNSVTVNVARLLSGLFESASRDDAGEFAEWTIHTGRNTNRSVCETFTIRQKHKYPPHFEGCSYAVKDAPYDIYYKFENGEIYFGCDSPAIQRVFESLFRTPALATPERHLISESPDGLPYVSLVNRDIVTGDSGPHGILKAFILAGEICAFISAGSRPPKAWTNRPVTSWTRRR